MEPNKIKKDAAALVAMLTHTTEALAVLQGMEVGFFDRMSDAKAVTLQELSGQMGYDLRMVERWLRFAAAAGYVDGSPDGYTLTTKGALLRSESRLPDLAGLHHLMSYFMHVLPYSKDAYRTGVAFDSITRGAISKDFIPRVTSPLAKTLVDLFTRAGLADGQSVLDLGCGDGSMLREIAKACAGVSAVGIDMNPHTIELGRRKNSEAGLQDQIELWVDDATELGKISDNAFDWVCAVNVLHFVPTTSREHLLREMARISRCGIFFTQITTDTLGACAADILLSTFFTDFTGFFRDDEADTLIRKLGIQPYASLPVFQGGAKLVAALTASPNDALTSCARNLASSKRALREETRCLAPEATLLTDVVSDGEEPPPRDAPSPAEELGPPVPSIDMLSQKPRDDDRNALEELNRKLKLQVAEKTEKLARAYDRLQRSNQNLTIANRTLESISRKQHQIDRIKSDLISIVSHELRTPLTSIKAFAEMILMKPEMPAETRNKLVTIIDKESDRLARLINDVLDLTKIEAGKLGWRITRLSVGDIIETAMAGIRSLVDNKGLTLTARVHHPLPLIFGDRDRLIQVFNNILSNAIKFTPSGGSIEVTVRAEKKPKPHVIVSVADTGMGIRSEELELIFEKFHRSGDILDTHPEGIGLGLTISRQIVEYHGGTIRAESKPGAGSTFIVTLPLNKSWKKEVIEDLAENSTLS